jgi:hypothetical protein
VRPYLENTHHKKNLVEWLTEKALSSNPSTTKKKEQIEKSAPRGHGGHICNSSTWETEALGQPCFKQINKQNN